VPGYFLALTRLGLLHPSNAKLHNIFMNLLLQGSNNGSVPRDIRGLPITIAARCPKPGSHEEIAKRPSISNLQRREMAISWVLENLPMKNYIPRENPTIHRLPPQVPRTPRPHGVLRAKNRYPLPCHVGRFQTIEDAEMCTMRLLKSICAAGKQNVVDTDELVKLKTIIIKFTPRQAFVADSFLSNRQQAWKLREDQTSQGDGRTDPSTSASRSHSLDPLFRRLTHRDALMELLGWKTWDTCDRLNVSAELSIGDKMDVFDMETSIWRQGVAIKETRRGIVVELVYPKKESNTLVLINSEFASTLIAPLFTHSDPMVNNAIMKVPPVSDKVIEPSRPAYLHETEDAVFGERPKHHHIYVTGTSTTYSPNKYRRDANGSRRAVPSTPRLQKVSSSTHSELSGTECILGQSYNVQKQYLGRHAIILGTSTASGGWVDIKLLNEDGTEGGDLRWRLNGIEKLSDTDRPLANKNIIRKIMAAHHVK
jgi:hypothetical protein